MGQSVSNMWEGSSRLVAWPVFVFGDLKNDLVGTAAGLAVGGSLVYFTYGNPVGIVENADLMAVVIAYAEMGIGLTITKAALDSMRK